MQKERYLVRSGSRVLVPSQWEKIREQLDPNGGYRQIFDGLLHTGARIVEFWQIVENPQWYHASRRIIDVPAAGACKKPQCKSTDRTIRLSVRGALVMDLIYATGIEHRDPSSMQQALKRAALKAGYDDTDALNSKMFRKMLVSYLVECKRDLGIDGDDIRASMGHNAQTMIEDYLGCAFDEREHSDMLPYLKGWKP
jgi:hypothetical protein